MDCVVAPLLHTNVKGVEPPVVVKSIAPSFRPQFSSVAIPEVEKV